MATYVPTNWKTGDVITATKLNNMETGIAGALQTSGGTMTGNITMSEGTSLIGNSNTSTTFLFISPGEITDYNNFTQMGSYYITNASFSNAPPNQNYSFLLVFRVGGSEHITQIAISRIVGSSICIRNYNGRNQTWGEWTTLG